MNTPNPPVSDPDRTLLTRLLTYCALSDPEKTAAALIRRFGSLNALLEAPIPSLLELPEWTENAAILLILALSLSARAAPQPLAPNASPLNPSHLESLFTQSFLTHPNQERSHLALLDARRRLLATHLLAEGPLRSPEVFYRLVLTRTLTLDSSYVVLAQSHAGGRTHPTPAEVDMTRHLAALLEELGIVLLDHIIFGSAHFYSMSAHGLLPPPPNTPCFPPNSVI